MWGDAPQTVFASDISMSLPVGGTFGKYASNAIILANGKTPQQVILDALRQVSLTFSPTSIPYGATNVSIAIAITRNLAPGTTVQSQTLKWKKTDTADSTYISLLTDTALISFNHTITPSMLGTATFTSGSLTYQYYIKDSLGVESTTTAELKIADFPIYYGGFDSSSNSIIPAQIMTLTNSVPSLTITTATNNKSFVVALPPSKTLTSVLDSGFRLTDYFKLSNISITPAGNYGATNYKVYIYTIAIPYSTTRKFDISFS